MRFPSKVTSYAESLLPVAAEFEQRIRREGGQVLPLFQYAKHKGIDTADFFQALDFLFMIGKISIRHDKEVVYVG